MAEIKYHLVLTRHLGVYYAEYSVGVTLVSY